MDCTRLIVKNWFSSNGEIDSINYSSSGTLAVVLRACDGQQFFRITFNNVAKPMGSGLTFDIKQSI